MKTLFILTVMLFSINVNAQWVQLSNGFVYNTSVISITSNGTNLFAGAYTSSSGPSGVYISTNNGNSWTQTALNIRYVNAITTSGTNVFAGVYKPFDTIVGVYVSSNNGANWTRTLVTDGIVSFATRGTTIFAGSVNRGIYVSTNNGTSWTQNVLNNEYILCFAVLGSRIFAGSGQGSGIYVSTNNGISWVQTSMNNQTVFSLAASGNNLYAGTMNNGVLKSTDNGVTWSQTPLNNRWVYSLTATNNNIFAGTDGSGVYISADNGVGWSDINLGMGQSTLVNVLYVANNYLFAGTDGFSVLRRPLNQVLGVHNTGNENPLSYSLSQNYPNPFNPITNVKFSILNSGEVKLVVYDVRGREVQTLVNEMLQPGTYETTFDGSTLNSGVYFYKLISEGFTETKKMLLIK